MRVLNPHTSGLVELGDCQIFPTFSGVTPVRLFGSNQWFALHAATGRTSYLRDVPGLIEHLRTVISSDELSEACEAVLCLEAPLRKPVLRLHECLDTAPAAEAAAKSSGYAESVILAGWAVMNEGPVIVDTVSTLLEGVTPPAPARCKALFLLGRPGHREALSDLGLRDIAPSDRDVPYNPRSIFTERIPTFEGLASRREGVLVDATAMTAAQADKAMHRLKGLGYDCHALFVGTRNEAVPFQRIFRGRRLHVIESFVPKVVFATLDKEARRILSLPVANPIGRRWMESHMKRNRAAPFLKSALSPDGTGAVAPRHWRPPSWGHRKEERRKLRSEAHPRKAGSRSPLMLSERREMFQGVEGEFPVLVNPSTDELIAFCKKQKPDPDGDFIVRGVAYGGDVYFCSAYDAIHYQLLPRGGKIELNGISAVRLEIRDAPDESGAYRWMLNIGSQHFRWRELLKKKLRLEPEDDHPCTFWLKESVDESKRETYGAISVLVNPTKEELIGLCKKQLRHTSGIAEGFLVRGLLCGDESTAYFWPAAKEIHAAMARQIKPFAATDYISLGIDDELWGKGTYRLRNCDGSHDNPQWIALCRHLGVAPEGDGREAILKESVDESKRETYGAISVLVNPTKEELIGLCKKQHNTDEHLLVRGLAWKGTLYFWPAVEGVHADVSRELHIPDYTVIDFWIGIEKTRDGKYRVDVTDEKVWELVQAKLDLVRVPTNMYDGNYASGILKESVDERHHEEIAGAHVTTNPSTEELLAMCAHAKSLSAGDGDIVRGLVDHGDVYVWPAIEAIHSQVGRELGLDPLHLDRLMIRVDGNAYRILTSSSDTWKAVSKHIKLDRGSGNAGWISETVDSVSERTRETINDEDAKKYFITHKPHKELTGGEWRMICGVHVYIKDGAVIAGPRHMLGKRLEELPEAVGRLAQAFIRRVVESKRERYGDTIVLVNPTKAELLRLCQKYSDMDATDEEMVVRGLSFRRDWYFWPAYDATHAQMCKLIRVEGYAWEVAIVPAIEPDGKKIKGSWVVWCADAAARRSLHSKYEIKFDETNFASFTESVTEVKKEEVKGIEYYVNPTIQQICDMSDRDPNHEMRGVVDADSTRYVWHSWVTTHDCFSREILGKPFRAYDYDPRFYFYSGNGGKEHELSIYKKEPKSPIMPFIQDCKAKKVKVKMRLAASVDTVSNIEERGMDPAMFKAVFTLSGPGAGKSFVADKMWGGLGLKVVALDAILEPLMKKAGLNPKTDMDKTFGSLRDRSYGLLRKELDLYVQDRLGLVIDQTGADIARTREFKKKLDDLGYDCMMVWVNTPLEVAWARNLKRPRTVSREEFESKWAGARKNIEEYRQIFGDRFLEIENSQNLSGAEINAQLIPVLTRKAMHFLRAPLRNPIGQAWIANQRAIPVRAYKEDLNVSPT